MMSFSTKAAVLATLFPTALTIPFSKRQSDFAPVINADFPDPAVFHLTDGTWRAYATNGNGVRVQVARSDDFNTWTLLSGTDALPTIPSWVYADSPAVWAPDVQQMDDGTYVMYFSATSAQSTAQHCVGTATSSTPEGPFTPNEEAFACDIASGGNIDPAQFRDADGSRWVVYKIDGNSIGHGGSCNNGVDPIVPTPIMIQQVDAADGVTKIGDAIQVLDRGDADGPLIEAPSLANSGGTYYLFFSSNCYSTTLYDVSYATASSVTGPYTKSSSPLFLTGDRGLEAPGGADTTLAGDKLVWHGNCDAGRCMFADTITASGGVVTPA